MKAAGSLLLVFITHGETIHLFLETAVKHCQACSMISVEKCALL